MFSALFAAYAVLVRATGAGRERPAAVQPDECGRSRPAAFSASSYMCGVMSLAITRRMRLGTYLAAVATFALGAAFLALELREFAGMIARGAGPQVSGFLSAFFHACRLPRAARHRRPGVVDRDDGPRSL